MTGASVSGCPAFEVRRTDQGGVTAARAVEVAENVTIIPIAVIVTNRSMAFPIVLFEAIISSRT